MNNNEFEAFFEERVNACRETLVVKAREYAMEGDRLHNFKVAAAFNGTSEEEACWWFASKHLVSLADMVKATSQGEHYVQAIWNEKLGDALNYLFLLDAIVRQDEPRMDHTDCERCKRAMDAQAEQRKTQIDEIRRENLRMFDAEIAGEGRPVNDDKTIDGCQCFYCRHQRMCADSEKGCGFHFCSTCRVHEKSAPW